jgi:hypothetical protein
VQAAQLPGASTSTSTATATASASAAPSSSKVSAKKAAKSAKKQAKQLLAPKPPSAGDGTGAVGPHLRLEEMALEWAASVLGLASVHEVLSDALHFLWRLLDWLEVCSRLLDTTPSFLSVCAPPTCCLANSLYRYCTGYPLEASRVVQPHAHRLRRHKPQHLHCAPSLKGIYTDAAA